MKGVVCWQKGYCSQTNEALIGGRGLRSGIQRKAYRNKPLTRWEKRYNQLAGKVRYTIERVFGGTKRWFGGLTARYVGLSKDPRPACVGGPSVQFETFARCRIL